MPQIRIFGLVAALACAVPSTAQDVVGLQRAVQEALAHNRSLDAANAGVREADALASQVRSAFFPRVSLVESWQRGNQPVFVFSSLLASRQFTAANFAIDALNSPGPTGLFRAGVSVEQTIFDGVRTSASAAAARLQRDVASFSMEDASAGIAVAVIETYGRLLAATRAAQAADAAVRTAEDDLRRVKDRRDAGMLSDADVLAVSAHLADARHRHIQARGDALVARAELNRLMGAPVERELLVEEPAVAPQTLRDPAAPADLFVEAEVRRPDLKRAAAGEAAAASAGRLARSSWYPQIAAQAGVEASGLGFSDRATSWIVGGDVRWTFSTGGAQFAARRAAAEAESRARIEREEARATARVEIATAVARLDAAIAQREAASAAADYAAESRRVTRDRFDAGIAGPTDLLRAESAWLDADTARTAALIGALVARARLDRAIGRAPLAITGTHS